MALPGQFAMLRGWPGSDPLLARPMSFHRTCVQRGEICFLYRVVGRGTRIMSDWRPGDRVWVLGPLGNGFPIPADDSAPVAVVGRGIGMAPLSFLARTLNAKGVDLYAFLSARTVGAIPDLEGFRANCRDVFVRTDDASLGHAGLVTDDLAAFLQGMRVSALYCCGSRRLARACRSLSEQWGIPAFVSLETGMACGVGACHGCVVATREGYKRVCKDGPVFSLAEVNV